MQYAIGGTQAIGGEKGVREVSTQRGATLVEIVLYLAVAALVIFAVFSLFGQGFGTTRVQNEAKNIQALISSVENTYGTSRDYGAGNMIPTLVTAKAVPSSMVVSGNNAVLRNAFGGEVNVTGAATGWGMSTTLLSKAACLELSHLPVGPKAFSINGTIAAYPVPTATAQSLCADSNTLVWDMG